MYKWCWITRSSSYLKWDPSKEGQLQLHLMADTADEAIELLKSKMGIERTLLDFEREGFKLVYVEVSFKPLMELGKIS